MPSNKIEKKQVNFIPYTTEPDEFCTISPAASPQLVDRILIEDSDDIWNKKCVTLQQVADLISTSGGLPYYECFENLDVSVTVGPTPKSVILATTQDIPAGQYRIAWNYMWNSARLRGNFNACVSLDAVQIWHHRQAVAEVDVDNEFGITCSDQKAPASAWRCVTFATSGTHTIEIEIFTDDTSYQVSAWDKYIEIQRVG